MDRCPYCLKRPADSDDHVFPQFLGGKATIRVCGKCNSTFGHSIEAAAFEHFKDWMLVFRRSGLMPPRPVVWRRVGFDHDGRRYDLDENLHAVLSDPAVTLNSAGKVQRIEGSPRKVGRIARSLEAKGATLGKAQGNEINLDMRSLRLSYPFDDDLRRLAIKMSIACAVRCGLLPSVSAACRGYLLGAAYSGDGTTPVSIPLTRYLELDEARPTIGHLVYVSCRADGGTFGVVQFFGAIQLHCELGSVAPAERRSTIGTHDPVSHHETFSDAPCLDYSIPPRIVAAEELKACISGRFERLRSELAELYGDQAPLSLDIGALREDSAD